MIDIHTHILPGIDDGASTVDESKEMFREAQKQGIKVCIATPHCIVHDNEKINNFIEKRDKSYKKLMRELADEQGFPHIFPGAEVYFDNDISKYPDIKKLCIADSEYMLIEMPKRRNYRKIAEWVYALTLLGVKPIIAHIDRYPDWLELVKSLGDMELIYQINASVFLSIKGRGFVRKFMKYNRPIIVGSDMHNTTERPCNMREAYKLAKKKFGDVADYFFRNDEVESENV